MHTGDDPDHGRVARTKDHIKPLDHGQPRGRGRIVRAGVAGRHDIGERPTRLKMSFCGLAVVIDRPTQLKATRSTLGMLGYDALPQWDVGRRTRHDLKPRLTEHRRRISKISMMERHPVGQPVECDAATVEFDAHILGLDAGQGRIRMAQNAQCVGAYRSDSTSEVEQSSRLRPPGCRTPCRQQIIGREPVTILQLVDPPVPNDLVDGFTRSGRRCTGRDLSHGRPIPRSPVLGTRNSISQAWSVSSMVVKWYNTLPRNRLSALDHPAVGAPVKSWTRTLNLDDAHTLLAQAEPGLSLTDWSERCHQNLPVLSQARRRELVRMLRDGFLTVDDGRISNGLFLRCYSDAPATAQFDMVHVQWALSHGLTLLAVRSLVAPALRSGKPEIPLAAVEQLVAGAVDTRSAESLRKSRTVLLGALEHVGVLETRGTGQHRTLRARRATPHPFAFAYLILRELTERGIDAMMEREALESSLAVQLTLCTVDHATRCLDHAVDSGWLRRDGDEVGLFAH